MTLVTEVNMLEKEISQVAKDTLAIYTVDRFMGNLIMPSDSMIVRNAKRGFLWETANNLEDEVLSQNSRFRQMDFMKVLDNTAYNGLVSALTETTSLNETVDSFLGEVVPASKWRDSIVTALILALSRKFGQQLEGTVVKSVSSLFA